MINNKQTTVLKPREQQTNPETTFFSLTTNTGLLLSRHSAVSSHLLRARSRCDTVSIKLRELEAELQRVERSLLQMERRHEELTR